MLVEQVIVPVSGLKSVGPVCFCPHEVLLHPGQDKRKPISSLSNMSGTIGIVACYILTRADSKNLVLQNIMARLDGTMIVRAYTRTQQNMQ